jgi:hypothetical protein
LASQTGTISHERDFNNSWEKKMTINIRCEIPVWIMLLGLAGATVGCVSDKNIQADRRDKAVHFTLGIIQAGQKIPIRGHRVTLEKRPFAMVFHFSQLGSMLVQASFKPELVDRARAGQRLEELLGQDSRISEDPMNPDEILQISDRGRYHNWLYLGPEIHRFDRGGVRKIRHGGYLCRRTVSRLFVGGREIPVAKCPKDTIYMLFVKTQRSVGSGRRGELQRDWLELNFLP